MPLYGQTFHPYSKTKVFLRQKSKNGIFAQEKKSRLIADFTLDRTGVWGGGGVSRITIMIGNFRVIKGLT